MIHLWLKQRNARQTLTLITQLPAEYDRGKILRVLKKHLSCGGCILVDENKEEVIQLQGDQREAVRTVLVDLKLAHRDDFLVHGF